jgi:uncharacterized protein (DUF488 family)
VARIAAPPRRRRPPPRPLYTIGHSTRTTPELIAALHAWGVEVLADIRHFTRSRANPQFNEEVLVDDLADAGVAYVALPDLGGRRGRSRTIDPARNAGWQVAAFKNYADYAETSSFRDAFADLLELARATTVAIMCAEAVWWRCHRRIVADHVLARGIAVFHIFTPTKAEPATLTPFARVDRRRATVRYP